MGLTLLLLVLATGAASASESPRKLRLPNTRGDVRVIAWKGTSLWAIGAESSTFYRMDSARGRVQTVWRAPKKHRIAAIRLDGRQAAVENMERELLLCDLPSNKPVRAIPGTRYFDSVAWSPSGSRIAVTMTGPGRNMPTRAGGYPLFKNDLHRVIVADLRGHARRLALTHVTADGAVIGHSFEGFAAAWSPDGNYLVSGMMAGTQRRDSPLQIWDSRSGKRLHQVGILRKFMRDDDRDDCSWSPAWRPDGKVVAAAWSGGVGNQGDGIRLCDRRTGRQIKLLQSEEPLSELAWSPNGRYLAAVNFGDYWGQNSDSTARLWVWDTRSGKRVAHWSARKLAFDGLEWKPDGKAIAAGSSEGSIRIWRFSAPGRKRP